MELERARKSYENSLMFESLLELEFKDRHA